MAITRKRLFRIIFCIILTLSIMASHMLAFPFVARANAAAVMTGGDLFTMIMGVLGWAADSPSGQLELYGDSYGHMQAKIIKAEASGDEMECAALYRQACELGFYDLVPASAIESYKQHILDTTEHPDWLRWIETQTSEGTLVQTCVDAIHKLSRDTMEFIDEWMDTLEIVTEAGKSAVNVVKSKVPSITALINQYPIYDKWSAVETTLNSGEMSSLINAIGDKYMIVYTTAGMDVDATRIDIIDIPEAAVSLRYYNGSMYWNDSSGNSLDICGSAVAWYYVRQGDTTWYPNYASLTQRAKIINQIVTDDNVLKINGSYLVGNKLSAIAGLSVLDDAGNPLVFDYDLTAIDTSVKKSVPVTNIGTGAIDENIDDWLEGDEEEKETYLPSPLDWNKVQNPADMKDLFDTTKDQIQDTEFDDAIDTDIEDTYPDEDDEEKKTKPTGFFFTQIFKAIYFLIMIIIALIMLFVKVFNFAFAVLSIQASPVFVNEGMLMGLNWLKTTKIVGFGISIWDFLVTLVVITLVFFIIRKIRLNIDSIKL